MTLFAPFWKPRAARNIPLAIAATMTLCFSAGTGILRAQETLAAASTSVPTAATSEPSVSSSLDGAPASPDLTASVSGNPALPEAPAPQRPNGTAVTGSPNAQHIVPLHSEYVPSGWTAPRLTAHDKVVAGLQDLYSLENLSAIPISAAYEYIVNSEPNYSPSDAFGKRVGAAAIRETTQSLFTEVVFAPLLHEDARYYQKGDGHGFIPRTLYAITRPLITRTDSGTQTINGALLLGYAGAAALTPAYYPSINRNFHDTASTFGGSIGGAALGFFVSEFSDDVLRAVHLKHPLK